MRVHRLVALAKFGPRALDPDVIIHHKDENKINPHPDNLELHDTNVHNAISARQAWRMKSLDTRLKKDWEEYFADANSAGQDSAEDAMDVASVGADEQAVKMLGAGTLTPSPLSVVSADEDVSFP